MNDNGPHNRRGELSENQLRAHGKGRLRAAGRGWWSVAKGGQGTPSEKPACEVPPTPAGWVTFSQVLLQARRDSVSSTVK